jgi:hypothetical protein
MKRIYEAPALTKREQLVNVTAGGKISPIFKEPV